MEYVIIIVVSVAAFYFGAKLFILKKQLKSVPSQLDDYEDKLISIELADRDLEAVTLKINRMIDDIQKIKAEGRKQSKVLKSSIADISHDMRTPLTSVIGYLQLARKGCSDDSVKREIDIALERAVYCNKLINQFFELSVLDADGCTPVLEPVDMAGIVCEQILANYPNFQEKQITPHFAQADASVFVFADKNMLIRIVQNLISNSIKYTSGDISFALSEDEQEKVTFTISNPTDQMEIDTEHIFDKFYRQENARSAGGSGLGLYICKNFAEAMGGTIEAEFEQGRLYIRVIIDKIEQ